MKYEVKTKEGEALLTLPRDKLLELLPEASEAELKTLIAICADPNAEAALDISGLEADEFNSALSYWRGAKLIGKRSAKKKADNTDSATIEHHDIKKDSKTAKTPTADMLKGGITAESRLPEYTSDDIKRLTAQNKILRSILDEAQQVFGKVFNPVEMNYIIAMHDHLALDGEYILMLLHYFRAEGRPLLYVAKVAESLVKDGISDAEALDSYLKSRDTFKGTEGRYRELFGIGARKLTSFEEKYFYEWAAMKMPFELVTLAFERTIEKKGTPQKSYIGGILKKWKELSLYTVDDVLNHEENEKAARIAPNTAQTGAKKGASGAQSFDVNEFFNAALVRSYGDKKE